MIHDRVQHICVYVNVCVCVCVCVQHGCDKHDRAQVTIFVKGKYANMVTLMAQHGDIDGS